jgi:hypothetical protein
MAFLQNLSQFIIQCTLLMTLANGSGHEKYNSKLHKGLNLKTLTILSPPPCHPEAMVDFLYIIHTAPTHSELRNTLRNSWAAESDNGIKTRRVFLIGRSNTTLEESIKEEHQTFGDIFMYDQVDAYRNMTIKVIFQKDFKNLQSNKFKSN